MKQMDKPTRVKNDIFRVEDTTFKSSPYDLAVDTIDEQDIKQLIEWLQTFPRLTMSAATKEFERAWSKWLGVKYTVFCNSGSSANLLMYAALDSAGRAGNRKIVVPAAGWVTTITPAIQLNFRPIMCEADADTYGLDTDYLRRILSEHRPDTVMVVHVLGTPNNMDYLLELQQEFGFQLMEDCCASHGSRHQGRLVGTFGLMSSFSFYYGHHMSTIEGGVVCTNDEELYYHLLMLRSHGWLKDLPPAEQERIMAQYGVDPFHSPFTFTVPGYNLRPTDLSAQIGLMQLPKLQQTIKRRVAHHRTYQKLLDEHFEFARGTPGDLISSISFLAIAQSTEERKKVLKALDANKIDTRIFSAGNLGRHPFWSDRFGIFSAPVADRLFNCGFFLPINQTLQPEDIKFICKVLTKVIAPLKYRR